ncbi:MAG: hypothetical protein QNJ63_15745 [Calothrix sp. MO_192.B10]|nr:hypothetical protein [Calothrix sp. MO_192.B10]
MNEAENPNNKTAKESLNNHNSPQSEQAMCPFYSVVPHQDRAIPQLPPAAQAMEDEPLIIDIDTDKNISKTTTTTTSESDWVAEPDSEQQALINAEFEKLLTLNQELRADNDDLYNQVEELKRVLADTEEALQLQKKRSSVKDSMLNQQTQELSAAQEQIKTLFAELDTAVQGNQRQESLVESYKAHLELSQQRLAQLERECAEIQTNYDEQSHRLLQSENACRELRTRLMRQQRQTLQFKAALEKCLDAPVPTGDFLDDTGNNYHNIDSNPRCSPAVSSLFSHTNPIQPWSADSESSTDDLNHTWEELCLSSPSDIETELEAEAEATQPLNWEFEPASPASSTTPSAEESSTEAFDSPATKDDEVVAHPWDEKLDRAIQALLANQDQSILLEAIAQPESSNLPNYNGDHNSPFPTATEEETDVVEPAVDSQSGDKPIVPIVETVDNGAIAPIVETIAETPAEDYWSDVPQVSPLEALESAKSHNSWDEYTEEQASPSPVIYPQRPPKGRKSLASVELPNFPSDKEQSS